MSRISRRTIRIALVSAAFAGTALPGLAAGQLSVEIVNGYNLVVDSNVTAPSTYAPRSAYIGGRVCNVGDAPIADVYAFAGNYNGGVGSTPGIFPSRSPTPTRRPSSTAPAATR